MEEIPVCVAPFDSLTSSPREQDGYARPQLPPPWSVEEQPACFVRDHNGQQLAYVYFEDEPGPRSATKLLSEDEARQIAANIAKLPEPLRQREN